MSCVEEEGIRPLLNALAVVCGRWRAPILHCLCGQPLRFSELEQHLDCITPKALSEHLRDLETNGLVRRHVIPTRPVITRYELTDYGRTIVPLLDELRRWGQRHGQRRAGA